MLTAKPVLVEMMTYHYAMNERLYQQLALLDAATFVREDAYSLGSLRNHMVHLMSVDAAWLNGLHGHPREHFTWLNPVDFPTFVVAHAYAQQVATQVQQAVTDWDEADLATIVPGMRETRWQVLVHLVTHGVDHRAQMLRMLHAVQMPTFPQDFIIHLWETLP
jgi:uncharacterized damage-inducible protein DinB